MQCKVFFIAFNLRYIKGWFCGFGISESNFVDLCRTAEAVTETRELIPAYLTKPLVAATPRGCPDEFREIGERMMAEWDEGLRGLVG